MDVVVIQGTPTLQLLPHDDQPLLFRGDTLLVLCHPFDILDGILRLKLQGNGLARDVFDKYVHGSWKISLCAAKLCAKYIITRRTPNTFQNSRSQPPLSR